MAEVVLIRHGETEWSASHRHTSYTDLDLTAAGVRQAAALGGRLAGRTFAAVLSSPRRRAMRTAGIAGLAVTEVDDIQRNILSILRRVAPNARIPASAVKIFVLQGALASPAVIDDEGEGDEVESSGSSGPYIVDRFDRYDR